MRRQPRLIHVLFANNPSNLRTLPSITSILLFHPSSIVVNVPSTFTNMPSHRFTAISTAFNLDEKFDADVCNFDNSTSRIVSWGKYDYIPSNSSSWVCNLDIICASSFCCCPLAVVAALEEDFDDSFVLARAAASKSARITLAFAANLSIL